MNGIKKCGYYRDFLPEKTVSEDSWIMTLNQRFFAPDNKFKEKIRKRHLVFYENKNKILNFDLFGD